MIVTLTWLLFHTRARPRSHWTIPPLDFISNQLPPPAVHSAWIKKPPRVKKPGTKRSGPAEGVGTLYMRRLYKCADTICQLCLYCQSFHRCWHQNTIFLNWFLTWNFRHLSPQLGEGIKSSLVALSLNVNSGVVMFPNVAWMLSSETITSKLFYPGESDVFYWAEIYIILSWLFTFWIWMRDAEHPFCPPRGSLDPCSIWKGFSNDNATRLAVLRYNNIFSMWRGFPDENASITWCSNW